MNALQTTDLAVGERLEIRRRRRGLSRKVVANLAGRSEEWLRLVESGRRKLDSIEVLLRLAEILHIDDLTELIDTAPAPLPREADHDQMLCRLRRAIVDHPALRIYDTSGAATTAEPTELDRGLRSCRESWNAAPQRYSQLARTLPGVLQACRAAQWQARDDASAVLLIQAYHLARQLLSACGDHAMAATVADRAMTTATELGDTTLIAASAWQVGNALLGLSYPTHCKNYAQAAADQLSMTVPDSTCHATLWGALQLLGAHATAQGSGDTATMLQAARAAAAALDADAQCHGIAFGPIEVGLTSIEIALTTNDPDEAIRLAATVEPPTDYLPARRTKYHIAQASAYIRRRDDIAAALALTKASRVCAEDIRYDPDARRSVRHLIRRDNYLVRPEVRHLAELAGLP
ncbi:helix-turn-helix domain-containing protein [Nocardia heshunensis]